MNRLHICWESGEFGVWLAKKMIENAMTVDEVARTIGTTSKTVSNHLHGRNRPEMTQLKKYAFLFGADWLELYKMCIDDYGPDRID